METAFQIITSKPVELVIAGVFAVIAFFGKRTLSEYDERIKTNETHQEEILNTVTRIDKEVVKIATKIECMGG